MTNDSGEVKQDLTEVKQRPDRIEHLLLAKQEQRLHEMEARMKKLEDALAV